MNAQLFGCHTSLLLVGATIAGLVLADHVLHGLGIEYSLVNLDLFGRHWAERDFVDLVRELSRRTVSQMVIYINQSV